MISVCGDDILYVTYEVVFSVCYIYMQLCTKKMRVGVVLDIPRSRSLMLLHATVYQKMRVGVVLDIPRPRSLMLLVFFKQSLLLTFHTSPAYSGFQALGRSFCVGRLLSTNLTTSEHAGWALPLLKLRQISRQFQFQFAFLPALFGFALCVVARLTSLACRVGATWSFAVKTSETAS